MASCAPAMWTQLFSCVGSFRRTGRAGSGRGRSQERLSPRRKVLRAAQAGGRGPGPVVSPGITPAQPQGEGLGLRVVSRELPFSQALLQGPSKPLSLSECWRPALKTGRATASGQSRLHGGSEGERGRGVCKTPQHRCPETTLGRRAGKGAPLCPLTILPIRTSSREWA